MTIYRYTFDFGISVSQRLRTETKKVIDNKLETLARVNELKEKFGPEVYSSFSCSQNDLNIQIKKCNGGLCL